MKRLFGITITTGLVLLFVVALVQADPVENLIQYSKKTTLTYPKTYTMKFSLWDADDTRDQCMVGGEANKANKL